MAELRADQLTQTSTLKGITDMTSTARTTSTRLLAAAVTAAALLLAGCAGDEPAPSTAETSTAPSEPAESGDDPGDDVSADHTEVDTTFAQMMVPHHRQAVRMSDVLLGKEGVDERVVTLARQIEAAQQPEIDQMMGLLEAWGEQAPDDDMGMGGVGSDDGPGSGAGGLMSDDEMQRLEDAEGVEAARLFLEQMTVHHTGAIEMARTELEGGQNPQALALAQAIVDAQEAEITEMRAILAAL